jgi:Ca-activated chloride channel family protein
MFTFGIGSSVNRYIIEGMARVGMGEPFIITKPGEARERAEKFRRLIQTPVLTRIGVNFGGFEVYDVEPPGIPDVLADRPVIVFGKWRGLPRGTIHVQGITGTRSLTRDIDVSTAKPIKTNGALRYLWARHRIALLSDYNRLRPNDERVEQVTDLGLEYNLLTAYTSFVAIDTQVRLKDGRATTVTQPLPLPQGVSDLAVGRGSFAQKAGSPTAPSANWMGTKGMIRERCGEQGKDKQVTADEERLEPALKGIHVELGKIAVTQGLSKKAVHTLLTQHIHSIKPCLKQALKKGPVHKGKVVLCFVIDPSGRVTTMRVLESQVKSRELEHCMVQQLRALLFPAPEGGKKITVTAAFSFR